MFCRPFCNHSCAAAFWRSFASRGRRKGKRSTFWFVWDFSTAMVINLMLHFHEWSTSVQCFVGEQHMFVCPQHNAAEWKLALRRYFSLVFCWNSWGTQWLGLVSGSAALVCTAIERKFGTKTFSSCNLLITTQSCSRAVDVSESKNGLVRRMPLLLKTL